MCVILTVWGNILVSEKLRVRYLKGNDRDQEFKIAFLQDRLW